MEMITVFDMAWCAIAVFTMLVVFLDDVLPGVCKTAWTDLWLPCMKVEVVFPWIEVVERYKKIPRNPTPPTYEEEEPAFWVDDVELESVVTVSPSLDTAEIRRAVLQRMFDGTNTRVEVLKNNTLLAQEDYSVDSEGNYTRSNVQWMPELNMGMVNDRANRRVWFAPL